MPINLPKELPQPILLKLAEDLQPVDKETQMDERDNVLVPVVPLFKSGSSWDGYTAGRVYIIWKGEVWRELQVTNDGYFADVDMSNSRKKQLRQDTSILMALHCSQVRMLHLNHSQFCKMG